jgi:hypothetical protein
VVTTITHRRKIMPFKIENDKIIVDVATLLGFLKDASEAIPELDGKDLSSITSVRITGVTSPVYSYDGVSFAPILTNSPNRLDWLWGQPGQATHQPRFGRLFDPDAQTYLAWYRDHPGSRERLHAGTRGDAKRAPMTEAELRAWIAAAPELT